MFYGKIKRRAIAMIILMGVCAMANSGQPKTSWAEYNYSFLEVRKLQKSANNGEHEDAYKLGMYYYLVKKNDARSIFWLKKAALGNHVEAIRELIKYYLIMNTDENKEFLEFYKQQLSEIALANMKPEEFYYTDLEIDIY